MYAPALRGVWSTWTSAAGKTYAVDWDNIFKMFGNNVTSDPNWIIKAMDAGYASGGPRVQVDTVAPYNPSNPPVKQAPSNTTANGQQVVSPQGQIVFGPMVTINPIPQQVQSNGPTQITPLNVPNLPPGNWTVYTNTQAQPSQPANPQGVPMDQFDFSTLPKMRAHAQLGALGEMLQDARMELENAHSIIIDFATAANAFYNDAVSEGAPSDVISALQSSYNDARSLVTQHTAIMNAFYAQTGVSGLWKSGPGLGGLWKSGPGLGRLGQWQLLAPLLGAALRQIVWTAVWVYIASIVGKIADSFKSNTDAAQAKFKTVGEYYVAWKKAKDDGTEPPPAPDDLDSPGGDMTTTLLIVGSVALAFILISKR